MAERLYVLRQEVLVEPHGGGETTEAAKRERRVIEAARVAGFVVKHRGEDGGYVVGYRPGPTHLVEQMFQGVAEGRVLYHRTSAVAHSTLAGLISAGVGTPFVYEGQTYAPVGPHPARLTFAAVAAVEAISLMVDRLMDFTGLAGTAAGLTWNGVAPAALAQLRSAVQGRYPDGGPGGSC